MNDRHSSSNVHGLPRLDRKDEPTFAARLKLYWAPIGAIATICGVSFGIAMATVKPFAKKADAATLRQDEAKAATDHDRIVKIEAKVDDLADTTAWTRDVVGELAAQQHIQPPPIPTPRATSHPTETP